MNKNKKHIKRKKKTISSQKDRIELHGDLLYRHKNDDGIDVEEIYGKVNIPGKYAGDC